MVVKTTVGQVVHYLPLGCMMPTSGESHILN